MFLPSAGTFASISREFAWTIPDHFNIGRVVSDDWAARVPDQVCLEHFNPAGPHLQMTYGMLAARSSAFAHALSALGISRGDRVALLLPQCFETAIAHVAIYKMGAIAVPLALLFGQEALEYRLSNAEVFAVITNGFGLERLKAIRSRLPLLRHIISVDGADADALGFDEVIEGHPTEFDVVDTKADDPALMIYTSGTTGAPKGALHGHRVLAGHIPGVQIMHASLPQPGDRLWTPSDWAWAGGLLNVLLPGLMLGVPVVSSPAQKFDPDMAFRIMAELKVRNAFIPPTALRLLRAIDRPRERYDLSLRSIGSAGEALGRETLEWTEAAFGVRPNEFYGQTECNIVVSSAVHLGVSKPGLIGKAVPGHRVAVIDDQGNVLGPGQTGQIAVLRPDPVMFLSYWKNPEATAKKFVGDWMMTGDLGRQDEDGYIEFFGRDDDVITSAGYRIGPAEIEDCLLGHPAVRLVAVIGKPDTMRTEIVKAFIVLNDGYSGGDALAQEISDWVKHRLSMHEYPREVAFVDELPLTTTGKVIRRLLRDQEVARQAG